MASSKSTAPSRLPDLVTDSDSGADDGPCDAESSSDEEHSLDVLACLALIARLRATARAPASATASAKTRTMAMARRRGEPDED